MAVGRMAVRPAAAVTVPDVHDRVVLHEDRGRPLERHGTANLHVRRQPSVLKQHDLLRLDEICWVAILVQATLGEAAALTVPRPARNEQQRELGAVHIAVRPVLNVRRHEGHDPFVRFARNQVDDHVVVPKKSVVGPFPQLVVVVVVLLRLLLLQLQPSLLRLLVLLVATGGRQLGDPLLCQRDVVGGGKKELVLRKRLVQQLQVPVLIPLLRLRQQLAVAEQRDDQNLLHFTNVETPRIDEWLRFHHQRHVRATQQVVDPKDGFQREDLRRATQVRQLGTIHHLQIPASPFFQLRRHHAVPRFQVFKHRTEIINPKHFPTRRHDL